MTSDAYIYLASGLKRPFDTNDDGEVALGTGDWAIQAARGVIDNLLDRRDIKHGFAHIDEDVRPEIVDTLASIIRLARSNDPESNNAVTQAQLFDAKLAAYDGGGRDMLNHLLALNPDAATALARLKGGEPSREEAEGRLPFDVLFWISTVAEQLGIMPSEAGGDQATEAST